MKTEDSISIPILNILLLVVLLIALTDRGDRLQVGLEGSGVKDAGRPAVKSRARLHELFSS